MEIDGASKFIGLILFVSGGLLGLMVRKRVFDRTNAFGRQQFSSYWAKLTAQAKDAVMACASFLFLSWGLLILAFQYADSWGWVVLLPIYAILLFLMLGT